MLDDCCIFNPLNVELNPISRLLALVGAHHILHVSRIRVNITVIGYKGESFGGDLIFTPKQATHVLLYTVHTTKYRHTFSLEVYLFIFP